MDAESIARDAQTVSFVADMRYHGQGYEIPVALERDIGVLDERFNALHEQLYGFRMPATPSEIVNLRAIGVGVRRSPELPRAERVDGAPEPADHGEIHFRGGRRPTAIYDRGDLQPGHRFAGPAIVTEFDSTTVVLPGYEAEVDEFLNILIRPEASA
jgi:N-methylhydantoinase A